MNRFARLKGARAIMPFLMLGDPDSETSFALIKTALDAGVEALELGIPFSDPIADGPIIQASAERALKAGMDFDRALDLIKRIRTMTDVPIAVLTYCNLLWQRGFPQALQALKQSGVDGLLLADLKFEDAQKWEADYRTAGIDPIFLIAPNTPLERAKTIHAASKGFTYLINAMGTTGLRQTNNAGTLTHLTALQSVPSEAPLVVGFGIHEKSQAEALWDQGADCVILGSKLVDLISKAPDSNTACMKLKQFLLALR